MYSLFDSAIIGGGIFGCLSAIELSKLGKKVILLEQKNSLMSGASSNNTNRLHLGYHYPRDLNTALQCKKGFQMFLQEYSNCILKDLSNFYCISKQGSKVNALKYENFCQSADLPFNKVKNNDIPIQINNVECVINTQELIYDCQEIKNNIKQKLEENKINFYTNSQVTSIKELNDRFKITIKNKDIYAKSIINSTYSNYNIFHDDLGIKKKIYQYELTIVPIIKWREGQPPLGITLMDGKFFSVLPHGKSGNYTLYHVDHSVYDRKVAVKPPSKWQNPRQIIKEKDAKLIYKQMVDDIAPQWLPSIVSSEFIGYLTSTRMVLSKVEDTDARPSLMEKMPTKNCFYNLFSGKIDHSIVVSKEVAEKVSKNLSQMQREIIY